VGAPAPHTGGVRASSESRSTSTSKATDRSVRSTRAKARATSTSRTALRASVVPTFGKLRVGSFARRKRWGSPAIRGGNSLRGRWCVVGQGVLRLRGPLASPTSRFAQDDSLVSVTRKARVRCARCAAGCRGRRTLRVRGGRWWRGD